ncbi:MAG: SUMF1/EgtB/PvdO family nonheme iron enzyme, partial [Kiritimatiellae bacterium]|nr:SUMF1/EgtB/PvdO family nonheme iron enzyme [Kiritimatiellia bacterium]
MNTDAIAKRVAWIACCALTATVCAMPTKQQLTQAQQLVNDLTADDLRALKSKEKTPGDVAAAHLALADKADTEAGKYLLLQGAFRLYARSGDYDAAAATLQRMRGEIAGLPPEVIVEIVNNEMRRVAASKAPKVLAIFRDAQRMIKYRKQLAAAELDATAHPESARYQRRVAECHACLGDWPKALPIFAKIGDEAAKWELGTAKDCDATKAADFWWNYKAADVEPFKAHAAALYKKGLEDGTITGLRKSLAEKRVKEMEGVMTDAPAVANAPAASGKAPSNALYCVIDLSAGPTASKYPVKWLDKPPTGGFNKDEYKMKKLVLRRIEPGKFMMGGKYEVTLTKSYYIGVFEVTQKQYELVTGNNPSQHKGDMRPVEKVSWNMVRGDSSAYDWPSSVNVEPDSFMGKIQTRTGLNFDLPTEAQWEYACRAGTTSEYNNGSSTGSALKLLGRYKNNKSDGRGGFSDGTAMVGSFRPNTWGLYDMHGNVREWCLDWWYGNLSSGVTDPTGPSSGRYRVLRGGSWFIGAERCTSSHRDNYGFSSNSYDNGGFRVCMNPEAPVGVSAQGSDTPIASGKAPDANAAKPGKSIMMKIKDGVEIEFILCPAGTFTMGYTSDPDDIAYKHKVTITRPFWMSKYPITVEQYEAFCPVDHSLCFWSGKQGGPKAPVILQFKWLDEYCKWLNRRFASELPRDCIFRLPTDAEWEYALFANSR